MNNDAVVLDTGHAKFWALPILSQAEIQVYFSSSACDWTEVAFHSFQCCYLCVLGLDFCQFLIFIDLIKQTSVFIVPLHFFAVCGRDLANVGFFVQNDQYFCPEDFQERFGTKCGICHQFLEGEGINVGGKAFHERCFVCASCRYSV